jgi:hypothetical protein
VSQYKILCTARKIPTADGARQSELPGEVVWDPQISTHPSVQLLLPGAMPAIELDRPPSGGVVDRGPRMLRESQMRINLSGDVRFAGLR